MAISQLHWRSLTRAINETKSPNSFLKRLLFGQHETKETDKIDLSVINRGRMIAPFVMKDAEALVVGGSNATFQTIEPPNIRIKRPFRPSELLEGRQPGTVIYPTADELSNAIRDFVAEETSYLADDITNSEELLCAQITDTGVITYQVGEPKAVFQITAPRPAGNNTAAITLWDDADASLPTPELDFLAAKRLISDAVGLGVTDVILGEKAASNFLRIAKAQNLLDKLHVEAGNVTFSSQFAQDGSIFHGTFCGVRVWEYGRTVSVEGVATRLIRTNYAIFVANVPGAEFRLYYGAIQDNKVLGRGSMFKSERFSKSWQQDDPAVDWVLATSRPLPWLRRPGAIVAMEVTNP